MNRFLFLGTGSSLGVPMIGCSCGVCSSSCAYNRRMRPSAWVEVGGRRFLVDVGPDFRQQILRFGVGELEGVILTHAHHDHTAGLDDLRALWYKRTIPLPIFLSPETASEVRMRFHYLFSQSGQTAVAKGLVQFSCFSQPHGVILDDRGEELFSYTTYSQAGMSVNGLRFGALAYVSDIHEFAATIFDWLKGVEVLVVSALRLTPSQQHFSVDEAVDFSRKVGAKQTWITHIAHELDHEKTNAYLPREVQLAYDGLSFAF